LTKDNRAMALDLSNLNMNTVVLDLAVVAASVTLLKQWLQSDVKKNELAIAEFKTSVDKRLGDMLASAAKYKTDTEYELDRLDTKFSAALKQLADSVTQFVQTTQTEAIKRLEAANHRERDVDVKVASLEVTVSKIDRTLDRLVDQMDEFVRKGFKGA
jgi:hypothetical protein